MYISRLHHLYITLYNPGRHCLRAYTYNKHDCSHSTPYVNMHTHRPWLGSAFEGQGGERTRPALGGVSLEQPPSKPEHKGVNRNAIRKRARRVALFQLNRFTDKFWYTCLMYVLHVERQKNRRHNSLNVWCVRQTTHGIYGWICFENRQLLVWWPGLSSSSGMLYIELPPVQQTLHYSTSRTIYVHQLPKLPWERYLAADLFF